MRHLNPMQIASSHTIAPPPAKPWDSFDAYLFDIDGTLLNCADPVHYFAFLDALTWAAGRPLNLDGVVVHGNTDVGILADALTLAGIEEGTWRPRLPEMQQRMATLVERDEQDIVAAPLPGVLEVLTHLQTRGALLGVATGNIEAIGWAKLRRAGLDHFFSFGGFSNHCPTRPEVFREAARQARALRPAASICVLGDTPSDITSAHANDLPVIAVATGVFTAADLAPYAPTWCVATLSELLQPGP